MSPVCHSVLTRIADHGNLAPRQRGQRAARARRAQGPRPGRAGHRLAPKVGPGCVLEGQLVLQGVQVVGGDGGGACWGVGWWWWWCVCLCVGRGGLG